MMTPLPGDDIKKPGYATRPFYGVEPILVDNEGDEIKGDDVSGLLAIKHPVPGMARSILKDHQRFCETYWHTFKDKPLFFTGDGAKRDEDGHYLITGRVDDVINVSGHRVGTAEIESAIVDHVDFVVEAAVVGYPHSVKGSGIYAYITFLDNIEADDEKLAIVKNAVRKAVGPFAAPDIMHVTPSLPKTRSGKIMRRILRKVAANDYEELGDLSTLNEPQVVDEIIARHQALVETH